MSTTSSSSSLRSPETEEVSLADEGRPSHSRGNFSQIITDSGRLNPLFIALLVVALISLAFGALIVGRYMVKADDAIDAVAAFLQGQAYADPRIDSVVNSLRLPRIIVAIVIGAGLAVSGAAFQSLFANPLATPDTLGVTAGTCVGAVIGLLLDWNLIGVQVLALCAGLVTVLVTTTIATKAGRTSIIMLVLAGVVVSAVANAAISLLKLIADPTSQLPEITYWLMGSLSGVSFEQFLLAAVPIAIGTLIIYLARWRLNILALSEDEARAVGADLKVLRPVLILAATLVTASVVSMCGQVGWVGLLVPHIVRMLVGHNNRYIIPVALIIGAIMMLVIDTLARTISPSEIPISVLTALVGAPVFVALLRSTGGGWR